MSHNDWTECQENGQLVYMWRDFKIRRVTNSASYLRSRDTSLMTFAWEATRNGQRIFRHYNLDSVKCHCENL